MRKMAIVEDGLCILNVKKTVSLQRCILQIDGPNI